MPDPKAKTDEDPENKPADGSGKETPPKPEDAKSFTQADLDRIAGEARKSEREKAAREKETEDKKRAEKELEAQGKLQELADTREKERDAVTLERDDYKGKYEALAATVKQSVDAEYALLPEGIRALAPADDDLDARLVWLPKAKQMVAANQGAAPPGNPAGPKATGGVGDAAAQAEARKGQGRLYKSL